MFDDSRDPALQTASTSQMPSGVTCPTCGKPMRIAHAEPDRRYNNLDWVTYTCDCGKDADHFMAREE